MPINRYSHTFSQTLKSRQLYRLYSVCEYLLIGIMWEHRSTVPSTEIIHSSQFGILKGWGTGVVARIRVVIRKSIRFFYKIHVSIYVRLSPYFTITTDFNKTCFRDKTEEVLELSSEKKKEMQQKENAR